MLLNGRQVIDRVTGTGLAELVGAGTVEAGGLRCRLLTGTGSGVAWIGWTANLQSSFGVSAAFRAELARRVGELPAAARRDAR